jgi:hypothetical protein
VCAPYVYTHSMKICLYVHVFIWPTNNFIFNMSGNVDAKHILVNKKDMAESVIVCVCVCMCLAELFCYMAREKN